MNSNMGDCVNDRTMLTFLDKLIKHKPVMITMLTRLNMFMGPSVVVKWGELIKRKFIENSLLYAMERVRKSSL